MEYEKPVFCYAELYVVLFGCIPLCVKLLANNTTVTEWRNF